MRDDPTRAATVLSYLAVRRFEGSSPFASTENVQVIALCRYGQGLGPRCECSQKCSHAPPGPEFAGESCSLFASRMST
jgi:hypothetical protein